MWRDPVSGGGHPRTGWNLPLPHVPEGVRLVGRGSGFSSGRQFIMVAGEALRVQVISHCGPRLLRQMWNPPLYARDGDANFELAIGAFDEPSSVGPLAEQVGVESRVSWFGTCISCRNKPPARRALPRILAKLKSLQHPDHDTDHWP